MEKIHVGVIGAGKMGILHSCLFNKLRGSELVAICDNTPMNLRLLRSALPRVKLYNDYRVMMDGSDLDLVVVTTPVFLHRPMAERALRAGSAVFVEKPLALNGTECLQLYEAGRGRTTLVGYCRRFMATYNLARKHIMEGTFGTVRSFDSHMYVTQVSDDRSGWQFDAQRSGGGVVMDLGSHGIDMLHYLLGDVRKVSATTEQDLGRTVEDSARLNFHMEEGLEGCMDVSWVMPGFRLPELLFDIVFDKGRIRVCEKYIEISEAEGGKVPKIFHKQMLEKGVQLNIAGQEYTHEDEHIIGAVMSGSGTLCDFAVAAKANLVIDAAYGSMRSDGDWISVRCGP